MMSCLRWTLAAALACGAGFGSAQVVHADDPISITGCVINAPAAATAAGAPSFLVWSETGLMMTDVTARRLSSDTPVGTSGRAGTPVLLWIDDEDDLLDHAGQFVEITGELDRELEEGEVEIERKDGFTEIEFEWGGEEVTVRVPVFLLGGHAVDEATLDVAVQVVDVEQIRMISTSCR